MPIFEYRLPDGTVIEKIRSWKDRCEPVPDEPLAELIPSVPYYRPETIFGTHPDTGKRMVVNDYDDPWEGTKGEGWAVDASEEFSAQIDEQRVAAGVADKKDPKRLIFT